MRHTLILFFLFYMGSVWTIKSQDTLKIRKVSHFFGAYYQKQSDKSYRYIVFDGNGKVYLFISGRKPKKVFRKDRYMGMAVRQTDYTTETKRVHFQFSRKRGEQVFWEEYECENLPDKQELPFKVSFSDKPVEVSTYRKYSGYKQLKTKP